MIQANFTDDTGNLEMAWANCLAWFMYGDSADSLCFDRVGPSYYAGVDPGVARLPGLTKP